MVFLCFPRRISDGVAGGPDGGSRRFRMDCGNRSAGAAGLPLAAALALLLGGCASLSESECQNRRWDDIGYEDGSRGRSRERIDAHSEACAKHGVEPDRAAWQDGYDSGLDVYCTPENAVRVGLSGEGYDGICPPESDREFASHWRVARAVYEQRVRVAQIEDERRRLEMLLSAADTDYERYEIQNDLLRLERQRFYERERLFQQERQLDAFMRGVR